MIYNDAHVIIWLNAYRTLPFYYARIHRWEPGLKIYLKSQSGEWSIIRWMKWDIGKKWNLYSILSYWSYLWIIESNLILIFEWYGTIVDLNHLQSRLPPLNHLEAIFDHFWLTQLPLSVADFVLTMSNNQNRTLKKRRK